MTIKRNTIQRDLVLNTVNCLKNHATTDEVYEENKLYHHYHAQCSSCGKIIDITMGHFINIEDKVEDADGFKLLGHDIIFFGLCKDCQNN